MNIGTDMDLIKRIFGSKPVGAAAIFREIAKTNADLDKARARLRAAAAALADIAVMTDGEHAAALADQTEATRLVARLEARIAALQDAHVAAQKVEADAALLARAKAAKRTVEVEAAKLLDRYDALAAELADVLGGLRAIREETDAVNAELRRNPVHSHVKDYGTLHRKHPDQLTPERREKRKKWVYRNRWTGCEEDVAVFTYVDGEKVPTDGRGNILANAYQIEEDVVVQSERVRAGMSLPSLDDIYLPPGRVGSKQHWPRES